MTTTIPDGSGDGRQRRRYVVLTLVMAAPVVVAVWAVLVGMTVIGAAGDLDQAATDFREARDALVDTDLDAAAQPLRSGVSAAEAATDGLDRWYVAPVRWFPVIGDDVRAAHLIATSVRDVGRDLEAVVEVARGIAQGAGDGDASVTEISLVHAADLAPLVRDLEATARGTVDEVGAIDGSTVVAKIAHARTDYLDTIGSNVDRIQLVGDVVEILPTLLGSDSPKTYLFAAGSLSELRSSGGLLGSWTLLRADGGRLEFGEFAAVDQLPEMSPELLGPSPAFAERYGPLGSLEHWRNVNFSPDFPSTAQVILEAWEAAGREQLDGVFVADTVTFERLAEHSGAVEVPDVGVLQPEDVLEFVGLEAYDTFDDQDERKRVLGDVASSLFAEVSSLLGDDDLVVTGRSLAELAGDGHLRIYSRDADTQAVLERIGLAGELGDSAGDSAGIFVNNAAANKVDYFTTREIDHLVHLRPNGVVRSVTEVDLHNAAPSDGLPRYVLGPWIEGRAAGDNRSMVQFVCSTTCSLLAAPSTAQPTATELGRPIVDTWVDVPAGESRTLRYTAESDGGWIERDGRIVLNIEHLVQPTLQGVELTVRVVIPAGFEPVVFPEGANVIGDEVELQVTASGRVAVSFEFGPTEHVAVRAP